MKQLQFSMALHDETFAELEAAAKVCGISPAAYAREAVEVFLLTRREAIELADLKRTHSHRPLAAEMSEVAA